MSSPIKIRFIGVDFFDRLVFEGENGRFYKTVALSPRSGFDSLSQEEKSEFLESLHTTDEPEGDPGFPCWKPEKFELIEQEAQS